MFKPYNIVRQALSGKLPGKWPVSRMPVGFARTRYHRWRGGLGNKNSRIDPGQLCTSEKAAHGIYIKHLRTFPVS
jgi:hypothetical protein